jgi:hypothetical protein
MLTGIDAIHEVNEVLKHAAIIIEANNEEVGVYIQTKTLNLKVRIVTNTDTNGKEKNIEDLFIRIFPPINKKGWGTAIFLAQVTTATALGFKRIICEPHGNVDTLDEAIVELQYNGYFTWARLGFTMVQDSESYEKYKAQLVSHNIDLLPLDKLLKKQVLFVRISANNTVPRSGKQYWKEFGFDWKGEFDLHSDSLNNKILLDYLKSKSLISRILHLLRKLRKVRVKTPILSN